MGTWALVNEIIHSIPSISLVDNSPRTPSSSTENTRNQKVHSRRKALGINKGFFNGVVNELFYAKRPEVRGRSLTPKSKDATLRDEWYNIAEYLLNRLERGKLSPAARSQLGSYSQRDYETWKQKASLGQLGSYPIDQLSKQPEERFYQLFPQQRGEKLNVKTFGQIWYAIAADKISMMKNESALRSFF